MLEELKASDMMAKMLDDTGWLQENVKYELCLIFKKKDEKFYIYKHEIKEVENAETMPEM